MREIDKFDMRETESLSCAAVLSPETHLSRSKSSPVINNSNLKLKV